MKPIKYIVEGVKNGIPSNSMGRGVYYQIKQGGETCTRYAIEHIALIVSDIRIMGVLNILVVILVYPGCMVLLKDGRYHI